MYSVSFVGLISLSNQYTNLRIRLKVGEGDGGGWRRGDGGGGRLGSPPQSGEYESSDPVSRVSLFSLSMDT